MNKLLTGWCARWLGLGGFWLLSAMAAAAAGVEIRDFGRLPDGRDVRLAVLTNQTGMQVKISAYGAIITELRVPDRQGRLTNVVLGFDRLQSYLQGHPAFGCTIGRFANRIGGAAFQLDGQVFHVTPNFGTNHIHGGRRGFDKVLWSMAPAPARDGEVAVVLSYRSPDGEEGYPGNLDVSVTFVLTRNQELRIEYRARTDKPTIINLTNHSYFNLGGAGDVLRHRLWIDADQWTPANDQLVPTGEIAPVKGTPLDFTQVRTIGERIAQLKPKPGGYDHNYVLKKPGQEPVLVARLVEPDSGRQMEVLTTQPGLQLYTANGLNGRLVGVGGVAYPLHGGVCFETQFYPDAINHPNFPSPILRPEQPFKSETVFRFGRR